MGKPNQACSIWYVVQSAWEIRALPAQTEVGCLIRKLKISVSTDIIEKLLELYGNICEYPTHK